MRCFKVLFCGIILMFLTGCMPTKQQTVTAVGSSALQPLVETASEQLMHQDSQAYINVQGGGSGTGLSQVQQQAVQIGNSDVFAEQKKGINSQQLQDHRVCVVAVVPIVNRQVNIRNLTLTQLQAIYMGKITNWQSLGGPNLAITVVNRAQGSGTRTIFEQQVMQGRPTKKASEQDSSGMVRQIVQNTPGAISYVAWPYLTKQTPALKVNGVSLSVDNVAHNRWPIWSYEHMYTAKHPNAATKSLLSFILSEQFQQQEVLKMRYVPIQKMHYQQDYT
ncbi:phosphate ABC transporter substrate-binding protein PstS family protein, partial [Lactobacillus sp. XV13L]|nr:phosphate ABC transporter substrate-binding protein PstS family protein [Lactobacillus sp. XV13L]